MTDRSGRRTPGVLVRAWLKVHQPRVISVLYFAIYAIAAAGGIMCSAPAEMGPVT